MGLTVVIIFIVDVLPAPLGPRNPNASPLAMSKSTASTATNSSNLLVSPRGLDERFSHGPSTLVPAACIADFPFSTARI